MRTLADPIVDWTALGKVALYSLIAGVGVPSVFALSVLGAARSGDAARARRGGTATAYAALSALGTAVCLAAVAYGIFLLTQK